MLLPPQISGYAELASRCAGCPGTAARLEAFFNRQGLKAAEVTTACAAQLTG